MDFWGVAGGHESERLGVERLRPRCCLAQCRRSEPLKPPIKPTSVLRNREMVPSRCVWLRPPAQLSRRQRALGLPVAFRHFVRSRIHSEQEMALSRDSGSVCCARACVHKCMNECTGGVNRTHVIHSWGPDFVAAAQPHEDGPGESPYPPGRPREAFDFLVLLFAAPSSGTRARQRG